MSPPESKQPSDEVAGEGESPRSDEEIPEEIEICKDSLGEEDKDKAGEVRPIELPSPSRVSNGSELASYLTPTGSSGLLSPERMVSLRKQQQHEELKRSTLNTAMYKSHRINQVISKPPLPPREKQDILEDSISDPHNDSLDEVPETASAPVEEEKRVEEPAPSPTIAQKQEDAKTVSIIRALDSGNIQMRGSQLEDQPKSAETKKEPPIVLEVEPESTFARADSDSLVENMKDAAGFLRSPKQGLVSGKPQNEIENPGVEVDTTHIEVVGFLGSGGEGKVYLGRITSLNEYVALKQFEVKIDQKEGKQLFDMIAKEVELVKTLNHQNIIKYYKLHRSNFRNLQACYIELRLVERGGI